MDLKLDQILLKLNGMEEKMDKTNVTMETMKRDIEGFKEGNIDLKNSIETVENTVEDLKTDPEIADQKVKDQPSPNLIKNL